MEWISTVNVVVVVAFVHTTATVSTVASASNKRAQELQVQRENLCLTHTVLSSCASLSLFHTVLRTESLSLFSFL